jgi:3-phenylpropionate/trans-cinnamate dioxygenase ferredoxin subunit
MARHVVAPARDIPPGERRIVTVEGRRIGVFNLDGMFYALLDRCPHQGGRLCLGDAIGLVQSAEPGTYRYSRPGEFLKCPWHGWEFDIRTGQSWCDPRRTRVRTYEVSVEPGEELVKGPYIAEMIPVSVEQEFVILEV